MPWRSCVRAQPRRPRWGALIGHYLEWLDAVFGWLPLCFLWRCASRDIREGYREVQREKDEARLETRRALRDHYDDRNDGRKLLTGVSIGVAVVGIATAVSNASEDDD